MLGEEGGGGRRKEEEETRTVLAIEVKDAREIPRVTTELIMNDMCFTHFTASSSSTPVFA